MYDATSRLRGHNIVEYDCKDLMKFFGITDDPLEAGYILPNGKFLDFSGRHLTGKPLPVIDQLRHDRITGYNMNGYCLTNDYPDLIKSDNWTYDIINKFKLVRCRYECCVIYIMSNQNITNDQKYTIKTTCVDRPVVFDIIRDFEIVNTFEFLCFNEDSLRKVYTC